MKEVILQNKKFELYINYKKIQSEVERMAIDLYQEESKKMPLFICLLNGSFMFTSDLLKSINFNCNVSFVKFSSYINDKSTGNVRQIIGLDEQVKDRNVIIIDDIIDTGNTIHQFYQQIELLQPSEIKIAAMFFKPGASEKNIKIDYLGMAIENRFVVGYGLDYNGLGRNYKDLYKLTENEN